MEYWAFLIIGALSTLGISEILIAYQKYQMKKQFLQELDGRQEQDSSRKN